MERGEQEEWGGREEQWNRRGKKEKYGEEEGETKAEGGEEENKAPPGSNASYGSSLIWREQSSPCAELRTFLLTRSLETLWFTFSVDTWLGSGKERDSNL